jgi:hypothetical protein
MKIRLVIATRVSEKDFFDKTATGKSLSFKMPEFIEIRLFANNKASLSKIYNQIIVEAVNDPAILIFLHDDIYLLDYYWPYRIKDALLNFKIIGLAGNKKRAPKQPSWAFINESFTWDNSENLSGAIGHGQGFPPDILSVYGPTRQKVKLLDGLLIAAESSTFIDNDLYFDEIFDFHFYDLDICRQAELKNISCGTWDLSVIHQSGGRFGSNEWQQAYQKYLKKWVN